MILPYKFCFFQDRPSHTEFRNALPREYQDFCNMIPFSEWIGPRGFFNIAAHYPWDMSGRGSFEPDLGLFSDYG
jgi:hypothetical protein